MAPRDEAEVGRLDGKHLFPRAASQVRILLKDKVKRGAVVHACNPNTWGLRKGQEFGDLPHGRSEFKASLSHGELS